ncbi:MAG: glycosyltransferase [Chthoniobacterales bacterium]
MKIVIGVGLASSPISSTGLAWNFLNWVLGFRELGWDVWMTEAISSKKCVDAEWRSVPVEQSANLAYWNMMVARFGLADRATLLIDDDAPELDRFRDFCAEADLFLNLSGHFRSKAVAFPKALKIYQDGDPAFTQVWVESYGVDMHFAEHDRFITAGTRLGQPGVFAPTCGIEWIPTFPPVVLEYWPFSPQENFDRFTSVAHWEGYKSSEWRGEWFHGKREEFLKFTDVPRSVSRPIELATHVNTHESELGPFREGGWKFVEAAPICSTLDAFSDYLRGSSAEFSIAKGGYVISRAGWFSDRGVCYAASGKPIVAQDTGVGDLLPVGEGYHPFSTPAEAIAACERVISDFPAQQRAARSLAEEYFDSKKVLKRLLDRL